MFIKDILQQNPRSFSFEFFPPSTPEGFESLYESIEALKSLNPTFVSVTYGTGGKTREKTINLVSDIVNKIGTEAMAHLTCLRSSKEEIDEILTSLTKNNVDNIMALRGDQPKSYTTFPEDEGHFQHAIQLVEFIKSNYNQCIGVAGYPETHQEAFSQLTDLEYLKLKVEAGADFVITQLFFDNSSYFEFMDKAIGMGIKVPIIPGIMPITNVNQIVKITKLSGAKIPKPMLDKLYSIQDNPKSVEQFGIEFSLLQCQELLDNNSPGIHFYTLNRSRSTWKILQSLQG
jgi:methylenetetrahydrofolate reductase (NADPH)